MWPAIHNEYFRRLFVEVNNIWVIQSILFLQHDTFVFPVWCKANREGERLNTIKVGKGSMYSLYCGKDKTLYCCDADNDTLYGIKQDGRIMPIPLSCLPSSDNTITSVLLQLHSNKWSSLVTPMPVIQTSCLHLKGIFESNSNLLWSRMLWYNRDRQWYSSGE
jgi:hypothetical protein